MTGPDATTPASAAPAPVGPPAPLLWLYLQVVGLVGAIGIALGALAFLAYRPLAQPYTLAMIRCLRLYDLDLRSMSETQIAEFDLTRSAGYQSCMRDPTLMRASVMVTGGLVLLLGLALIVVLNPVLDHWRLRRHRLPTPVAGAEQRFAAICDELGLSGRRRPRLFVAAASVRQAFTTVLPGGRPLVVLPAAVAVAHADPARFDPVVRHELAHVQGRDVRWVSAVRGLLWLVVPAVVLANLPELLANRYHEPVTWALGRALVLVLLSILLRALLLRLREHEADRHAARTGDPAGLSRLLSAAAPARSYRWGWLRRVFARHPTPQRRVAALRSARPVTDGGPVQALVTGAVTAIVGGAVNQVAGPLTVTREFAVLPAAVVGVLLGFGLTPALRRRALVVAAGGYWPSVAAAAAGLAGGAFLFPTAAVGGGVSFPLGTDNLASSLRYALLVALAGAVAVTICAVLAGLLARRGSDRPTDPRRPLTYLAAVATVTALWLPLPAFAFSLEGKVPARVWLVYVLPDTPGTWLGLAWPVVVVVLVGWRRIRTRTVLHVMAVVVPLAGLLASAQVLRDPPATLEATRLLVQQRGWICALAGWATLVVLGAGRGNPGLGRAVVAGAGVAMLTGMSQFVHQLLAGYGPTAVVFRLYVGGAVIWWFYAAALTVPVLAGLSAAAPVVGRWAAEGSSRPVGRRGWWRRVAAPLVAGVLVVAAAVNGPPGGAVRQPVAAPPVTVPPDVVSTVDVSPGRAGGSDPGRVLSVAEAGAAAEAVRARLSAAWAAKPPASPSAQDANVVEPAACGELARGEYLRQLDPDVRVNERRDVETAVSPAGIVQSSLIVRVASYARPVPATALDALDVLRGRCSRFVINTERGMPVPVTARAHPMPRMGEQTWGVRYEFALGSGSSRITVTSLLGLVRIGHNVFGVELTATGEPANEQVFDTALGATMAALAG